MKLTEMGSVASTNETLMKLTAQDSGGLASGILTKLIAQDSAVLQNVPKRTLMKLTERVLGGFLEHTKG